MRTKDRLAELKKASTSNARRGFEDTSIELNSCEPVSPQKEINEIFEEVERIHDWIRELTANTLVIRHLHADPTFHNNKLLQDRLDSLATSSNALGLKICGALKQLERRSPECSSTEAAGSNNARARIIRLQYACVRRQFSEALGHHQSLLQAVRNQQLQLLHEQIKLTNFTISDDECEALLESKNMSLFVDNVKTETAEARQALRAVEERHEELARVEAALRDVRDLFLRLSHLVAEQQEQIDNVQHFALQASDYVESGEQKLLQGVVKHKKANQKKTQLIICLVVGFLIVLLVLIAT